MAEYAHRFGWWHRWRCCPPPPRVVGVTADPGGGSGEVLVTWDPLPADEQITHNRVYRLKGGGAWWLLAVADNTPLEILQPGRLGIVDTPRLLAMANRRRRQRRALLRGGSSLCARSGGPMVGTGVWNASMSGDLRRGPAADRPACMTGLHDRPA